MRAPHAIAFFLCGVFAAPALVTSVAADQGIVELPIILDTAVASNTSHVEQPVRAHLSRDVRLGDDVVIPAGSELYGHVTAVRRPGKVKGRSYIAMRFTTVVPRGSGERYSVDTGRVARTGRATKKTDAMKIGVPAAGGAAIGALIGGKKGALIGAGAGGGAGTAVVLSTRGAEVGLGRGAPIALRLAAPVTVRVRR